MPLHPDREAVPLRLHRLQHAVRVVRDGPVARMLGDRLVMVHGHGELRRDEIGDPSVGVDAHVCRAVGRRPARMPVVADHIRQMLHQRPACGDGHELHAPADPEQREPDPLRFLQQRELPGVAVVVPAHHVRVGILPVPAGVHVGAARDEDAVQAAEHGRGRTGRLDRRQQHRDAARAFDRSRVVGREQVGLDLPPGAPVGGLAVGRDPDDRSRVSQSRNPAGSRTRSRGRRRRGSPSP